MSRPCVLSATVLLAVLAFFTATACDKTQLVRTKRAAVALEDVSQPRVATLAQQKMCAEQADKQFKIYGAPQSGETATQFVSHYDAKANVCYMMIHRAGMTYGKTSISDIVFDAFENHDYATYLGGSRSDTAPLMCDVKPRGQSEVSCKSLDEFESLVEKYFGIAR